MLDFMFSRKYAENIKAIGKKIIKYLSRTKNIVKKKEAVKKKLENKTITVFLLFLKK
jgi:hypothetical protein